MDQSLSTTQPPVRTADDATLTPASARRRRARRRTPGVVLIPPDAARAKLNYSLRWRDPATRGWRYETLRGITTEKAAQPYALRKSVELDERKRRLAIDGQCAVTMIADEVRGYVAEASLSARKGPNKGKPLGAITVRRYTDTLAAFAAWCAQRELTSLRDLTRAKLSEWRAARRDTLTPSGQPRRVSTLNHELKPVRQMLLQARAQGRFESLDSDAINGALLSYPEAAPAPVCLSVPAMRALLQAVVTRDARRGWQAAPAFAIALLAGTRRAEVTAMRVSHFNPAEPTEYDPAVTHPTLFVPVGKTGPRTVELLPYSPLLVELLGEMVVDRAPTKARLGDVDYAALGKESTALAKVIGFDFSFKTLRSTCASYQGPIAGDAKSKADRLGHTMAVAQTYYLALPKGTPRVAPSLDALMQLEPELRAIIDAVKQLRAQRANQGRQRATR